jgi:hypothetical protein
MSARTLVVVVAVVAGCAVEHNPPLPFDDDPRQDAGILVDAASSRVTGPSSAAPPLEVEAETAALVAVVGVADLWSLRILENGRAVLADGATFGGAALSSPYGIAVCDGAALVALQGGEIARTQIDAEGVLAEADLTAFSGLLALACDETTGTLYAATIRDDPAMLRVHALTYSSESGLVELDSVALGSVDADTSPHLILHPVTRELWLVAAFGAGDSYAARVTWTGGRLEIAESPVDIGAAGVVHQVALSADGALMVAVGWQSACDAAWQLPSNGALPAASDLVVNCGSAFGEGHSVAVRSDRAVFYHPSDTALRASEVVDGALVSLGRLDAPGGPWHARLSSDETLLVTASVEIGTVRGHLLGPEGSVPVTSGAQVSLASETRGMAVVPWIP